MRGHKLIVLLLLILEGQGSPENRQSSLADFDASQKNLPCPNDYDIFPCTCKNYKNVMDLNCSLAESEDQLDQIFGSIFPFKVFRSFIMNSNGNIKILKSGLFRELSFTEFMITHSALETVEEDALSGSYDTAVHIHMNANNLTQFPFEKLPLFGSLVHLNLGHNKLLEFPVLSSASLRYLSLGGNLITAVLPDAFTNLVEIEKIEMNGNQMVSVDKGTYAGHHNLYFVNLESNQLTTLPAGAIQLTNSRSGVVMLSYNKIANLSANAITDVGNGIVHLENNTLSELKENVFRPLLQDEAHVSVAGNPFICGCEIAWLYEDLGYLDLLDGNAACYNGELLTELDPGMFSGC